MADVFWEPKRFELFSIPPDSSDEEARKLIDNRIETVGAAGRYMCRLYDKPERYIQSHEYMYRASRKTYDLLYRQQNG